MIDADPTDATIATDVGGRLSYEVSLHVKNTCGGQPGARLVASSTELRTAELLA